MILEKLTGLDIEYFEDSKFRDLLEKVKEAIGFRPQNLLSYIMFSAQTLLQFVIALVAIIQLDWIFVALIALIAFAELLNQIVLAKRAFWFGLLFTMAYRVHINPPGKWISLTPRDFWAKIITYAWSFGSSCRRTDIPRF